MHTDPTPLDLDTLTEADRDMAELYGELQAEILALRFALVRSLLRDPDDVDGREPLWRALYSRLSETRWRLDWIRHALTLGLEAIDRDVAFDQADDDEASSVDVLTRTPIKRPDGTEDWVSTAARLHPGLHYDGPIGWFPGDPDPEPVEMPAAERERLPELYS